MLHTQNTGKLNNVLEILQSDSNLKHDKLLGQVPVSSHQCRNIVLEYFASLRSKQTGNSK